MRNNSIELTIWLARMVITADRESCWDWPFSRNHYGRAVIGRDNAAQVALALDGSPRPETPNDNSLHTCDNVACVNPAHLWWGTQDDNMEDMKAKGRRKGRGGFKGSNHNMAKLDEFDVRTIRNILRRGTRFQHELADEYGVTQSTISAIHTRKVWDHVA